MYQKKPAKQVRNLYVKDSKGGVNQTTEISVRVFKSMMHVYRQQKTCVCTLPTCI